MRKSSRLWWLHGVVLLSAMVGCKTNSGGSCGTTQSAAPPLVGGQTFTGSPTGAGATTMYPPGSPTTNYQGAPGGQTFTPPASSGFNNSASPMYSQPGMNTSGGPAFGAR